MRRIGAIVFLCLGICTSVAGVELVDLCMDGVLLFRKDFGGNDPSDPEVISNSDAARAAVSGMSTNYIPCTSRTSGMSSGKFLVTKQGYQNGIQWHLMDDHTSPNDLTKGYFLQIDGRGDNEPFYTTTIDALCSGSRLTFSAYVANVMTWGHYMNPSRHDIYPRLKFVLTDPVSGSELATYDTGDIPFDSTFIDVNDAWRSSAHWRLIGMNFTLPDNINRITLTIYNSVSSNGSGNDFAIDDIEIRLCTPPITIDGEAEVCMNQTATLSANFTNDGTFDEPLAYKWWFSPDSLTWTERSETTSVLSVANAQQSNTGWYKVAVAGAGEIESVNCRAMSEPFLLTVKECVEELCMDGTLLFREDFGGNSPDDPDVSMANVPGMSSQYHNAGPSGPGSGRYTVRKEGWANGIQWHRQDDHTYPDDKTRGYLLEVDGRGGTEPFYSTTIDGLCAGSKLTFSAYVVNVHYAGQLDYFGSSYVYPRMKFVLKNPETGEILAEKSTGDIQPDWSKDWATARANSESADWQLIGMNFTVPDGIESIQMYIYNDVDHNGSGNDFALDDIEIRLCLPKPSITSDSVACKNTSYQFNINFENDGSMATPLEYQWYYSSDSLNWSVIDGAVSRNYSFRALPESATGWYSVAVAGDGNIESVNCRAMSDPFHLRVEDCLSPVSDLCMDGVLLFREDFGGNDPNDPTVSYTPVASMDPSYVQIHNWGYCEPVCYENMQSGRYLVAKKGYRNSDNKNYSCWHIMDDHTYPDDYTRGYLLEIDGGNSKTVFYSTVIHNLCSGSQLTFSAYVANVTTSGHHVHSHSAHPKLTFVLSDPLTGLQLASYDTDTIPPDWSLYGQSWELSARWNLVGMNFEVPTGIDSVRLSIVNNVSSSTGNDFALDDIEIRLCLAPPIIISPDEACLDSVYAFEVEWNDDGMLTAPVEYKWWYSIDSLTWVERPDFNGANPILSAVQPSDSGWYKVAVSGEGNIDRVNCRAMSEPFYLHTVRCPGIYHVSCDTTVCHEDSILYFGRLYAAPGTYLDTVFSPIRVDTAYQLTIADSRSFRDLSITIIVGNPPPYPWEDVTVAGIYRDTLVNALGCDSIVTWYISFKERCVELFEKADTIHLGDTYQWRGRTLSVAGDYRDTLFHQELEACDTVLLLHLHVDSTLTVEQMELEYGCATGERLNYTIRLSRLVDTVQISFSAKAKAAGLRDTTVYMHGKGADIVVPHPGANPGSFTCEVALVHDGETLYRSDLSFTLLYPATVLEQAWNDVVAVLTHDYNGGYDFVAFQWYENGVPLTGENHSYLYRPLIMGGEYSALLTAADGTQAMTCPLIATYQTDISLYPTVLAPRQVLRCYVAEEAEVWLYDALGRLIAHEILPAGETLLAAPGTSGVYIATVFTRADKKEHPYKLIVQ